MVPTSSAYQLISTQEHAVNKGFSSLWLGSQKQVLNIDFLPEKNEKVQPQMPYVTGYLFACDRGIEGLFLPTQISRHMGDKESQKKRTFHLFNS